MENFKQLKENHEKIYNQIFEDNQVFWAFSDEQFKEGKKKINITDNKDLFGIGGGGYLPKSNKDNLKARLKAETERYRKEIEKRKELKNAEIKYQLYNHECFYTGDISTVIEIFQAIYTVDEIKAVYNAEKENANELDD